MIWVLTLAVLGYMAVVMVGAWGYGQAKSNGGWTDVFWSWGTGIALAAAALFPIDSGSAPLPRQALVAAIAILWSMRLGLYLTPRVASHPEDVRYAKFREQAGANYPRFMLFVALPQAPASALLALSVIIAARTPGAALVFRDILGLALALIAIGGELVADAQMKAFKAVPANKGKVCDLGLWGWSRHPNYFFEWLIWLAYPVIGLDVGRPLTWLTFVAPAVMFLLLTRVSGIPPLEQAQIASKGDAYRTYQKRVSAFFPLPPKTKPN